MANANTSVANVAKSCMAVAAVTAEAANTTRRPNRSDTPMPNADSSPSKAAKPGILTVPTR